MRIEVLIDVKTVLGEGPLWDVDEQRLYFIDSFGCNVFRCTADGGEVRAWDVRAKIGSMALRRQGGAVLALANGFRRPGVLDAAARKNAISACLRLGGGARRARIDLHPSRRVAKIELKK